MSYIIIDDSDVDVIDTANDVRIFIDLRGKDFEVDKLRFRADNTHLYIYDLKSGSVVKIVNLAEAIEPNSINIVKKNGTITIIAKKISLQ